MFTNQLARLKPFSNVLRSRIGLVAKLEFVAKLPFAITKWLRPGSRKSLQRILKTKFAERIYCVKYGGLRLFLGIDDLFHGLHLIERESEIPIEKFVHSGSVVCDVGAHIGTHTLRMAQIVGDKGRVIALEPNLRNLGLLCLNVNYNNYSKNVQAVAAALFTHSGTARLYKSKGSIYNSLVRESDEFEEVRTISFEGIFERCAIQSIDFMKIDIEGAEGEIILAERNIFQNGLIKSLYIDPHTGVNYDAITNHLAQFNYKYLPLERGHLFYLNKSAEM